MSGGLDSPTIAAVALDVLRERSTDFFLEAITSVYDRLIPDSERYFAGLVAEHLNIPIRYDVRDDETSIADWDQVSVHTPEPVDNPPAFAAGVEFFKDVATQARVFLYGEGPDNALRYEWRPYVSYLSRDDVCRTCSAHCRTTCGCIRVFRLVVDSADGRRNWQREHWREVFPGWLNGEFAARFECRERWEARQQASAAAHPSGLGATTASAMFDGSRCSTTATSMAHGVMPKFGIHFSTCDCCNTCWPCPPCRGVGTN